ncbi:MAG: preprotein translocase subunit SecA [Proteobacteria bacterium]|nr:preprotein translocase subunit SecA [Pseudomonadota bacterium]
MIKKVLHKIFGTRNDRLLKSYNRIVLQINALEASIQELSDDELQNKTLEFKNRLKNGEVLADILAESFAVCREASKRVLGMRHFDMQLVGGIALNDGKIAEMRTGEGKTLVATLAAYLNSLSEEGVHVVTVNDYLAKRDALEMGRLYNFLGLSVGINLPDMSHQEKSQAYSCDITYGTNNEFGFDYLRDNMVFDVRDKVQKDLNFAIVDEVDSILIDEARTPLIISGPADGAEDLYIKLNQVPSQLVLQEAENSDSGEFWVDEKNHNVVLSESGHVKVEQILLDMGLLKDGDSLYSVQNISLMHHLLAALKAHYVYLKDQHYVVQDGEVIIVDEFTGRLMSGRRWSDGLHQAVEAKEGVKIQRENQTMASITFQNYFRMYKKLSGMTGTADTEAYEFQQIYSLETVVIPTNKPMVRSDYNDKIYMNLQDKYNAIVLDIKKCHDRMQPVLVGTTSVENSEVLSKFLTKAGLKHEVLNAKQHAREADIIVQAGRPGGITVATNMAGRGTDIILGGNIKPEIAQIRIDSSLSDEQKEDKIKEIMKNWAIANKQVLDSGGLAIVGTERHESRRIDNQLRGRSGRQGDPGLSMFYLSLDDPLLRIFGGERMRGMMQRFGIAPGESIEHKWLSRSIESAQRKVEGHNFDIRKQLLDYDNVSNAQRKVIYYQRGEILKSNDVSETTLGMIQGVIGNVFDEHIRPNSADDTWNVVELEKILNTTFLINYDIQAKLKLNSKTHQDEIKDEIVAFAHKNYFDKMSVFIEKVNSEVLQFINEAIGSDASTWDVSALDNFCAQNSIYPEISFVEYVVGYPNLKRDELISYFNSVVGDVGKLQVNKFERGVLLQYIDYYWREHLTQLEHLRQGIHLRGYAQKDPKREFQTEAYNLFSVMLDNIKNDATRALLTVKIQESKDVFNEGSTLNSSADFAHQSASSMLGNASSKVPVSKSTNDGKTLNRNSLCTCGSGKKYKHCHGKIS